MAWLFWLIAAAGLAVAEFFSLTVVFGIFGAAALAAALSAGLGAPWALQILVFVLSSLLGVLVVRPIALRHMARPALVRDGTDALVGAQGLVLEEISADGGLIKLAGEHWTARPYDDGLVIGTGESVDVMEIQGATAIVYPHNLPLTEG